MTLDTHIRNIANDQGNGNEDSHLRILFRNLSDTTAAPSNLTITSPSLIPMDRPALAAASRAAFRAATFAAASARDCVEKAAAIIASSSSDSRSGDQFGSGGGAKAKRAAGIFRSTCTYQNPRIMRHSSKNHNA
jgi:hypothetical protein